MASTLDVYVKNVILFTSSDQLNELVDMNRKAVTEVLERNTGHLNRVFEALSPEDHSLSVVTVLLAKMNHLRNSSNAEKFERVFYQIEVSLPLFNKDQILLAPELYIALFHRVYEAFPFKSIQPLRVLRLFSTAISKITSEDGEITSLHSCLFCLSLRVEHYDESFTFLRSPVVKIFKETASGPYMDARHILLYFYYGALIFGSTGDFEECLSMLESVLSVPAIAVSAVMVEAYKKYILVSLIVHGKVMPLPNYRAVVIPRVVKRLCAEYLTVEKIFTQGNRNDDKAGSLLAHLEENMVLFRKDGNVGLIRRVIRKIREKSIISLTKCFVSLSLAELVQRCHLENIDHAERYLVEMTVAGTINAQIDKQHGFVNFNDIEVVMKDEALEKSMRQIMETGALLKEFDTRIRCNSVYVNRCTKSGFGVHDDEGFQQGSSFPPAFAPAPPSVPLIEMLLPS